MYTALFILGACVVGLITFGVGWFILGPLFDGVPLFTSPKKAARLRQQRRYGR